MSLVLHDSGRGGKLSWAQLALTTGTVERVILCPWETPASTMPRRPSLADCLQALTTSGVEVLFDPTTHGFVPGANHLKYYNTWNLWQGAITTSSDASLLDHVRRVIASQQAHGVRALLPTLPLRHPVGNPAERALRMAQHGLQIDDRAIVGIAADEAFWETGDALDAFVGKIAELRPTEVLVTVIREASSYPVDVGSDVSVAGLCRTIRSLAIRSRVTVAYGDLAALPGVASGAHAIGTGWDLTQRLFVRDRYVKYPGVKRSPDRVSFEKLLAVWKRQEAERLRRGDPAMCKRLLPGSIPPDSTSAWLEHIRILARLAATVIAAGGPMERVVALRKLYARAQKNFGLAIPLAAPDTGHAEWIAPVSRGLERYAFEEGL